MIRINLVAPEKAAKAKAKAGPAMPPGALQSYLLLALLVGGALRALRRRLVAAVQQAARPRHADRGRREAPARPAGDRDAGGPVPAEEGHPREQGARDRAAAARAEEPGAHARRDLEGAARLRVAERPWTRRRATCASTARATASRPWPTSSARCSAAAGSRRSTSATQPGGAEPRELHAAGRLQGPGGRRRGKGDRRGQGRCHQRPPGPPGPPGPGREPGKGGRTEWPTTRSPSCPSPASWGSPPCSPRSSAAASTTSGTPTRSSSSARRRPRLADLQKQIRALEATANSLPEFQREVQALEAQLETLKRILPPEKEMPDLMRRIQYLAAQSSLQIRKFNPARRGHEGLLPGDPDQHRRRGHLPQHGRLPRPRQPDVAPRQRERPQDQGAVHARRSTTRSRSRRRPRPTSTWTTRRLPARRHPARSGRDPEGHDEGPFRRSRCSPPLLALALAGQALAQQPAAPRGPRSRRRASRAPAEAAPGAVPSDASRPPLGRRARDRAATRTTRGAVATPS